MATSQKKETQTSSGSTDAGQAEVQARFDEANAKGYFGTRPDGPAPEEYALGAVTKNSK